MDSIGSDGGAVMRSGLVGAIGAFAVLLLVAALAAGSPAAIGWAVALVGLACALSSAHPGRGLDLWFLGYGAGIFLSAELAYWSLDRRTRVAAEPRTDMRRWMMLAMLVLGGSVSRAAALAVAAVLKGGGVVLGSVKVLASLALVGLIAGMLRQRKVQMP
jgi:hypothetical protein